MSGQSLSFNIRHPDRITQLGDSVFAASEGTAMGCDEMKISSP